MWQTILILLPLLQGLNVALQTHNFIVSADIATPQGLQARARQSLCSHPVAGAVMPTDIA